VLFKKEKLQHGKCWNTTHVARMQYSKNREKYVNRCLGYVRYISYELNHKF